MYDIWKQQPIYSSYGIHTPAEQLTQKLNALKMTSKVCNRDGKGTKTISQYWYHMIIALSIMTLKAFHKHNHLTAYSRKTLSQPVKQYETF